MSGIFDASCSTRTTLETTHKAGEENAIIGNGVGTATLAFLFTVFVGQVVESCRFRVVAGKPY